MTADRLPDEAKLVALANGFLPPYRQAPFDPWRARQDFPILRQCVHGRELVWLDNAATTQKPLQVVERLSRFYLTENSNVHRGAHTLAARATDAYEGAREQVCSFLNAGSSREILFVRGTTEAINLVAQAWGDAHVGPGDEILISALEHHANIVPWQMLCGRRNASLRVIPMDGNGRLRLEELDRLLNPKTKLLAVTQLSNVLGTAPPLGQLIARAHSCGVPVLVDGAQAAAHLPTDVRALGCDFYAFSGHKVYGPLGIGALVVREEMLEELVPWQGGGNMIADVTHEHTTYNDPPHRFEAGTASIADAVGLGAALQYLTAQGREAVYGHEQRLTAYAEQCLLQVPGLTLLGASPRHGTLPFLLEGWQPEDVGAALDRQGIAVRAGHHCAQPVLRHFGCESVVRASLALYNTRQDVDRLADALVQLQKRGPGFQRSPF